MWNLLMGNGYSSEEDEGNDEIQVQDPTEDVEVATHIKLRSTASGLAALHSPKMMEVHRIPSPTRECGDGSEAVPNVQSQDSTLVTSQPGSTSSDITPTAQKVKWIRLPQTNIRLEKLPPIRDDAFSLPQTEPASPLVQMNLSHPQRQGKAQSNSASKQKQPKFVPYEPYKAALTPIWDTTSVSRNASLSRSRKASTKSLNNEEHKDISNESNNTSSNNVTADNLRQQEDTLDKSLDKITDKDKEILRLRNELEESEKKLRIQTQINHEVKRLLVASVGEDIEAKVDYLTQDKARLSADIRQYASKISRDFEEKEKLTVESTLWKSKFLACSVIVDELARWKANLIHRNDEYEHNLRLLFHEHSVMWSALEETFTTLANLRSAFDPLSPSTAPRDVASITGLTDLTLKVALELKTRLMGETKLKEFKKGKSVSKTHARTSLPKQIDTPAEEALKQVLNKPVNDESSGYSELASLAVTGAAKPHLRKLGDQLTSPSGFKNCTHCHGTVQNI